MLQRQERRQATVFSERVRFKTPAHKAQGTSPHLTNQLSDPLLWGLEKFKFKLHPQSNPEMSESVASNLWGLVNKILQISVYGGQTPEPCGMGDPGSSARTWWLVVTQKLFSLVVFRYLNPLRYLRGTCFSLRGTCFSRGLRGQGHERCGQLSASQKQREEEHTHPPPPTQHPTIVRARQGRENIALGLNSSLENSLLTFLAKQSNKFHPKVTLLSFVKQLGNPPGDPLWQGLLPVLPFGFSLPWLCLWKHERFKSWWSPIYFSFVACVFVVTAKRLLPNPMQICTKSTEKDPMKIFLCFLRRVYSFSSEY